MMETPLSNDRRIGAPSPQREIAGDEGFDVRLRFGSAAEAYRYLCALTSLLFGPSTKVTATLTTGASREDLDATEIAERLARACWDLFALDGYARVDFRVDASGLPFVLEINANPCLSPDAGFAAALARAGIGYGDAIGWLIADARRRVSARDA